MTEKATRVDTSKTIVGIFRLKRRKKRLRSASRELLLLRFLLTLLLEEGEGRDEGDEEGEEGDDDDDEVEGDDRRLVVAVFVVEVEVEEGEKDEEEFVVVGSSTSRRRCSLRTSECIVEQCQNRQTRLKIKSQNVLFSNFVVLSPIAVAVATVDSGNAAAAVSLKTATQKNVQIVDNVTRSFGEGEREANDTV